MGFVLLWRFGLTIVGPGPVCIIRYHVMKSWPTDDLKVFVKLVEELGPKAEQDSCWSNGEILQDVRLVILQFLLYIKMAVSQS